MVRDIDVDKISRSCCKDWERLPPYLEMKKIVVNDINREGGSEEGKRRKFFTEWIEEKGREATYKKLIGALLQIGCRNDAEKICKLLQSSLQPVSDSTPESMPDGASNPAGNCEVVAGFSSLNAQPATGQVRTYDYPPQPQSLLSQPTQVPSHSHPQAIRPQAGQPQVVYSQPPPPPPHFQHAQPNQPQPMHQPSQSAAMQPYPYPQQPPYPYQPPPSSQPMYIQGKQEWTPNSMCQAQG